MVRRAPLGFGSGTIDDTPVTLTARCTRPFVVERVFCIGNVIPVSVSVDGEPYEICSCEGRTQPGVWVPLGTPKAGTTFALTLWPLEPRAPLKWWQLWKRRARIRARHFVAAAKGTVRTD
jgi:hypothetical protein